MFTYICQITQDDFEKYNLYYIFHSKTGSRLLWLYRLVVPIISVVMLTLFYLYTEDLLALIIEAVVMFIFSVLMVIFAKPLIKSRIKRGIKISVKDGKLEFPMSPSITFDDEEIKCEDKDGINIFNYSKIKKIVSVKDGVYLFITENMAYIIPERYMTGEGSRAALSEFLVSKVPSALFETE